MYRASASPSARLACITRSLLLLTTCVLATPALAASSISYRLGTLGFGLDYNRRFSDCLTLRVGYNLYYMGRSEDSSGVHADASLSVSVASMLIDWHPWRTPLRVSIGLSQPGPQLRADAQATGSVELNGQTYSADQFGSIHAEIKSRYAIAPYVGIGRGFAVGDTDRFTLLLDAGALYTGAPKGHVEANCAESVAADVCTQLLTDLQAEVEQREYEARHLHWWPVLSVGFSMRW